MNNIENYIKKICYCRLKKPNKMGGGEGGNERKIRRRKNSNKKSLLIINLLSIFIKIIINSNIIEV